MDYNSILLAPETVDDTAKASGIQVQKSRENKKSSNQENKKSRAIIDSSGRVRRPVNITLADDVKIRLDVLAARRQVRVWTLIDQALREFLDKTPEE